MRKLILKMSVSLDGFVGGPNGEIDWIFRSMSDDGAEWTINVLRKAGLHIMGSRTFHDMAAWWPTSKEPFAPVMNEIPKAVFTKKGIIKPGDMELTTTAIKDAGEAVPKGAGAPYLSPHAHTWNEAIVAKGDLSGEIKRLKRQPGKDIVAHGGAGFAQSLVATGLIDEYYLLTHPVALGKGLPLFSAIDAPLHLQLISATTFKGGTVAHVYRPA